jgi:hypothetical protein
MFRVILLVSLVLSCSAFFSTSTFRQRVGTSSLLMGNLIDNFRFVRHYNRFTFKTLYKCLEAAGLEETLAGPGPFTGSNFFMQLVMITHAASAFRSIHHLPLLLSVFAPTDAAFAELPWVQHLSIFNCIIVSITPEIMMHVSYNSEGTIEALLADIPKLQSILTYHVLNGVVDQKTVKAATSLVTLNGKSNFYIFLSTLDICS